MRIISIALKDLLVTLKDKKALALITLTPIILILVLGVSLSSMFRQDGVSINKFDVAVVDKDGGELAGLFLEVLKSEQIKKMIDIKEMKEAEAMDKVRKGDIPVLIVVPQGFSQSILQAEETKICIYEDPGSPMRGRIVESIVKSCTNVGSALQGSIVTMVDVFRDYKLDGYAAVPELIKMMYDSAGMEVKESNLQKNKSLSAMQYYSAAMLVMYILFVGMLGTFSIILEREQKTLLRLMSTTVSKGAILTGKLLGLFLLGIFDALVIIVFTRYVFNVSWGNSVSGVIILSCAMIFAACGLAMFIASVFKTSKSVESVNPAIIMVMSFLGGCMFPLSLMPQMLQAISKVTLNNWALTGYLNLMLDNGVNSIISPSIILFAMGAAFLAAGISRLKLQ